MNEPPEEISCQELQIRLAEGQPLLLLDCREQDEHNLVCIKGDTLLPMSELVDRQSELTGQENCPTIVYCHHGLRSQRVAAWLREQGFTAVQSLTGGIDSWAEEIDPEMMRY
jgi:rhodanese-related sulfurtransferase